MKTILVPTDFSKNADNACKYAIEIARETKAKIILMHTFETPVLYSDGAMMTMQVDYSVVYNSALNKLKRYHDKISKTAAGVKMELVLQQGLPSARIKEIALEKKADLIVVGTTGKGALEKMLMGSNAARLIRNAPCLVLTIPPKAKYEGLKKIAYATDLSEDNLNHALTIIPFAKIFNSEILFLNIDTHLFTDDENSLKTTTTKIKKHIRYPKMEGYVCNDPDISNGINFFLKKHKADCLAMYTHHRGIMGGIFNRSITKEVALHTSVPLLVIHEKDFTEDTHELKLQKEKVMN